MITKEQNVVMTFYLFMAASFFAGAFHKWSVFFAVIFLLGFVLKLANSIVNRQVHHSHGLSAAEPGGSHVRPNTPNRS